MWMCNVAHPSFARVARFSSYGRKSSRHRATMIIVVTSVVFASSIIIPTSIVIVVAVVVVMEVIIFPLAVLGISSPIIVAGLFFLLIPKVVIGLTSVGLWLYLTYGRDVCSRGCTRTALMCAPANDRSGSAIVRCIPWWSVQD